MLPTEKTKAALNAGNLNILLHGDPGVGKTTFAADFPGALFMCTEAGTTHLDTFEVVPQTWLEARNILGEFSKGNHQFKTIVIDTVDNFWKLCRDHVNAQNKIEHEAELGYGRGSGMILREFERRLDKLAKLPYGVVLITHTEMQEITTAKGKTFNKFVSAIPKKPRRYLNGLVDVILYATTDHESEDQERVLRADAGPDYSAKDRTGRLPAVLPLDFGAFSSALGVAGDGGSNGFGIATGSAQDDDCYAMGPAESSAQASTDLAPKPWERGRYNG